MIYVGLQTLYLVYNVDLESKNYIKAVIAANNKEEPYRSIPKIFKHIDRQQDNEAKLLWINRALNWDWRITSLWGCEETRFYDHIQKLCQIQSKYTCDPKDCRGRVETDISPLSLINNSPEEFERQINDGKVIRKCSHCGKKSKLLFRFINDEPLPFIFYVLINDGKFKTLESGLPDFHSLRGHRYKVICYSLNSPNHFIEVFKLGRRGYLYDGLAVKNNSQLIPYKPKNEHPVNVVWALYNPSDSVL